MIYRYLLRISYIGTFFKSFQKMKTNEPTIVGAIEGALQILKPLNEINVQSISRTDAGVHALSSAVVVDFDRKSSKPFEGDYMASILNKYFNELKYQIRINKVEVIPNDFNQNDRAVQSRTYLYRLGIMKPGTLIRPCFEEHQRCSFFVSDEFDIESVNKIAKMFVGYHDFRSFMKPMEDEHFSPSYTLRRINYVRIEKSSAHTIFPLSDFHRCTYYDIIFNAPLFLSQQIRIMVGILIEVGKGKMGKRDVYEMLTIPSRFSNQHTIAPCDGLYLADIEFRDFCNNVKE